MGGPLFSFYISFKEDSNPNEILIFLINKTFDDYFIPQSVYFQYKENESKSEHYFGVNRNLIKKQMLLPEEKELGSIGFTKLNQPGYQKDILEILSKKPIWEYGFSAYGSLNIYYQHNSDLMEDFFFREKMNSFYNPIIEISGHNMDISKYATNKTYEHEINFAFINSSILLDDRWSFNNKIASEKNLEILIEKIRKLINKFKNMYDYSVCNTEGLGYSNKLDDIQNKFSILPNFEGVNWG